MLDGDGWGAHAVFAGGVGSSLDSAAWAAGLFVFLAIHNAGVGALRHGICAGHVGSGIFGPRGRY